VNSQQGSVRAQSRRREVIWAWASLVTLVICWDRSARLDERVSPPRIRIAHALDRDEAALAAGGARTLSE
jgi:hypothetical protein